MKNQGKAEVSIFGQNYTIVGDMSPESISKIAAYVDDKMELISSACGSCSTSQIAVLAAINIAEDLYQTIEEAKVIQMRIQSVAENEEKKVEADNRYEKLWKETKTNFAKRRYELQNTKDKLKKIELELKERKTVCETYEKELEDARGEIAAGKEAEAACRAEYEALKKEHEKLKKENEKLKNAISMAESLRKESMAKKKALDEKEKEFENEFIEIQMENAKLKNELEKYKKEEEQG